MRSYVNVLAPVFAIIVATALPWQSTRAGEPQAQYRGFTAAGTDAVTYDRQKQELMSALHDCRNNLSGPGFNLPQVRKSPRHLSEFYPLEARRRNAQAVVVVAFMVDSLGNTRFLHVGQSFPLMPDRALITAAMQVARSYALNPASLHGQPVSYWTNLPVRFILQNVGGPMGSLLNQDAWLKMLDKANAGDVQSIVVAGYVAEMVGSEAGLSGHAETSLVIDSALQGADYARMQVYRSLSRCSRGPLVEPWVSADAKAGLASAQMTWAQILWTRMLSGGNRASQMETLSKLLHTIVAGADPFYRLWAAGVLATEPGLRDPATALKVALSLNARPDTGHQYDPDYAELLAAAQAANSQFGAAVQSEQEAIGWARRDGWNLQAMQSRLATYRAGRPWFGHLCDCQQFAPDSDAGL